MFYVLVCCLLWDGGSPAVKFSGTELYQPLRRGDVVVSQKGEVFILNYGEAVIRKYAADGSLVGKIGSKGQGPGEFMFPGAIMLDGEHLFVYDMAKSSISRFDLAGKFQDSHSLPGRALEVGRAGKGWLTADWRMAQDPNKPVVLNWHDNDFKNSRKLAEWPRAGDTGIIEIEAGPGSGKPKVPYSPVRDQNLMAVSSDGNWAAVSQVGDLHIDIWDMNNKSKVKTITMDEIQPIPFNETWGRSEFETFEERNSPMKARIDFVPKYPEHFPIVRDLYVSGLGQIVVLLWTGNPDTMKRALVFDHQGKQTVLPYKAEHEARIMAISGQDAYISLYEEEDDQASLLRIPVTKIDATLASHPLAFEGFTGRMMMQMD